MNYIVELIIRPARNLYQAKDLGEKVFFYVGQMFKRQDFDTQIRNNRGQRLSCSFWSPNDMNSKELSCSPCIIYCHGNGGNKIDIVEIFDFLLWDFNICSFDFSGAGYSEGDFVTLGFLEKDDIKAVVEFLRKELGIQKIILWGRSMGAVSILRYAENDPNIKAIVLDSPFSNFSVLCQEILSNKFFMPSVVSRFLINMAREKIMEKIPEFDIYNFKPSMSAKNILLPTIMIHGKSDGLVGINHSREIINNFHHKTIKKLLEVDGDHNDYRSVSDVNLIKEFIKQFSYDPLVLKEYKRRLLIQNSHNNFTEKNGIDLNFVLSAFKNTMKDSKKPMQRSINNFNLMQKLKNNKKLDDSKKLRSKSFENDNGLESLKEMNASKPKNSKNRNKSTNKVSPLDNNNIHQIKLRKFHKEKENLEYNSNIEYSKKNDDINNINNLKINSDNQNDNNSIKDEKLTNGVIKDNSFNLSFSSDTSNKHNKLRTERHLILGGVLGGDMRIKSNQIKINTLDKSTFRKNVDNSKIDISYQTDNEKK